MRCARRRAWSAVLTADDVPGENDISSVHKHDEPVFATTRVVTWGQPSVCGDRRRRARPRGGAAKLVKIEYRELPHITDVDAAIAAGGKLVTEPLKLERGDVEAGLAASPRRVEGHGADRRAGAFLSREPGRAGRAGRGRRGHHPLLDPAPDRDPGDGGAGARHPACGGHREHAAHGRWVRRQGDAGQPFRSSCSACGEEAQPARSRSGPTATTISRSPASATISPSTTMSATTTTGKIQAVDATFAARAGYSADLSGPVTDRALFHADNAYWYPAVRVNSLPLFTNTVSNTAFRGFGGPQGIIGGRALDRGHRLCAGQGSARDPQGAISTAPTPNNITPYHQDGGGQRHPPRDRRPRRRAPTTRRGGAAILEFNRQNRGAQEGHRA